MAQLAQHMAAGSAAGGIGSYGGDDEGGTRRRRRQSKRQKGASQKRKLEKAQEHLRSKMRQRLNGGPAMVSSRVQRAGSTSTGTVGVGGESLEVPPDGRRGDVTVNPRVVNEDRKHGHVGKRKQLTGNYWRTQQQRYSNITHPTGGTTHPTGGTGNRTTSSQEDVPLHDLVDRVLKRKEKSNHISPLMIRAYNKPPNPSFKIQQHPLARTMPTGQPLATLRKHSKDKGPYVLVVHRDQQHQDPEEYAHSEREINTWRPELDGISRKPNSTLDSEDRGVTNYKLQLQQAAKLAEARFDYSNRATKFDALPPIKVAQVEKGSRTRRQNRNGNDSDGSSSSSSDSGESDQEDMQTTPAVDSREKSSQDILKQMQAYKRSRRRVSESDFKTILRTRNRFTAKTKQFKEDLSKAKALSVIDEDQSSVSSGRNSCLSARRHSQTSLRNVSAKSLNRIEETKTPELDRDIRAAAKSKQTVIADRSTSVIEEDEEESDMITDEEDDDALEDSRTSLPYEFSSNSNPLPAIMHILSHNTDSNEHAHITTSTQRPEQTITLPSRSIIPEIGK